MDNQKDNVSVCHAPEEKVIRERNKMCMANAMIVLHAFREMLGRHYPDSQIGDALDVTFEWIDEAVLLSKCSRNPNNTS